MKKIICVFLTIAFLLSLAACENDNNENENNNSSPSNATNSVDENTGDSPSLVNPTKPSVESEQTQPSSPSDNFDFSQYDFTGEWGSPYNDQKYLKLIDGSLTLSFGGMPYYGEYTKEGCADHEIKLMYGADSVVVTLSYEDGIVFLRWPDEQLWSDRDEQYVSVPTYYFVRPDDFEKVRDIAGSEYEAPNFIEDDINILGKWVDYYQADSVVMHFYDDGTLVYSKDGVVKFQCDYSIKGNIIEVFDPQLYFSDEEIDEELIEDTFCMYVYNYAGFYEMHTAKSQTYFVRPEDVALANRDPDFNISIVGEWGDSWSQNGKNINVIFYENSTCQYTYNGVVSYGTYRVDDRTINIHHGNETTSLFLQEGDGLNGVYMLRLPGEEVWDDDRECYVYTGLETIYRVEDYEFLRFIESILNGTAPSF